MGSKVQRSIPDILYKYRSLSGQGRDYVRQTIVENKVYFSSPSKFNDPFDCRVHMTFGGSDQDWKDYLVELFEKNRPGLNYQQRQAEAHRIVKIEQRHRNPQVLRNMIGDLQQDVYNIGVFSLSARCDDILMWSYYAENHTGLCLGFLHRVGPLGSAVPVEYSSTFPQVDCLKDDRRRQMEANLLTKAAQWQHEDEWRVISYTESPGLREYPPELLAEVILGARISSKDRDDVLSWVDLHSPRPRVCEARLRDGTYGLEIHCPSL